MPWMSISIQSEKKKECAEVVEAFQTAFLMAQSPKDAALFSNNPRHPKAVYYFSPGATRIFSVWLEMSGARKCDPPTSAESTLLIGHGDARHMLK